MYFNTKKLLRISLFNLLLVASLGVLMRYKIGFDFPYFNQYNIHHAHSHLAFIGWITHTLLVLMTDYLREKKGDQEVKKYIPLIILNLLSAYGLLISFFVSGYSHVTVCLLVITIGIAAAYTIYFFRDLKSVHDAAVASWFKAALSFNLLSTAGTFYLAYMMMTHHFNEKLYLASEYFYLHFQYNGFFIFACMGLFLHHIPKALPAFRNRTVYFQLFFWSVIPAYFLSTLWANLPTWLYVIVVIAACAQLVVWLMVLKEILLAMKSTHRLIGLRGFLFLFVGIAFTIKLLLQLGSTVPILSKLAFGFRPVVIAYLHLVLLAVISIFLITLMHVTESIQINKRTHGAIAVFLAGVFLNELVLAIQGAASFSYSVIPFVNEFLFGISLVMFSGAFLIFISQFKRA